MRYIQKAFVLAFLVVFMWLFGCEAEDWSTDPPPTENIVATNKIRKERGVREIKDSWTFYIRRSGKEVWKDKTRWICKNVHYDRYYQEIRYEADYYYSGRTFLSPDGVTTREKLLIGYFYGPDRFYTYIITDNKQIESMVGGLKEWMKYPSPDGDYLTYGRMGKTNEETLEVADKILKMWGLERL
ncbi:MAG: hypothetical protein ACYS9C_18330 [Planctomycetota bacterium]|jgi:hypothetical protein